MLAEPRRKKRYNLCPRGKALYEGKAKRNCNFENFLKYFTYFCRRFTFWHQNARENGLV